jgi:hypothetical protein
VKVKKRLSRKTETSMTFMKETLLTTIVTPYSEQLPLSLARIVLMVKYEYGPHASKDRRCGRLY